MTHVGCAYADANREKGGKIGKKIVDGKQEENQATKRKEGEQMMKESASSPDCPRTAGSVMRRRPLRGMLHARTSQRGRTNILRQCLFPVGARRRWVRRVLIGYGTIVDTGSSHQIRQYV